MSNRWPKILWPIDYSSMSLIIHWRYWLLIDYLLITHWLHIHHYAAHLFLSIFTWMVRDDYRQRGIVHTRLNGESNWIHRNPRFVPRLIQCIDHLMIYEKNEMAYIILFWWTVKLPKRKCSGGRVVCLSWLPESRKYTCEF